MGNPLEQDLKPLLDPLYRYAMALTLSESRAQDLVQDAVLRAIRHRDRFEQMVNKKAWMFKVLSNLHRDSVRQCRRRPETVPLNFEPISNETMADQQVETTELREKILGLFQKLGEVQRQVMYLRCVEGFSIKQIAESISTSENNVKANLSIARKKISQMMKRSDVRIMD